MEWESHLNHSEARHALRTNLEGSLCYCCTIQFSIISSIFCAAVNGCGLIVTKLWRKRESVKSKAGDFHLRILLAPQLIGNYVQKLCQKARPTVLHNFQCVSYATIFGRGGCISASHKKWYNYKYFGAWIYVN